jgi:radical SAM-linked protein
MPRISFLTALPVGTESLHETLEIEVDASLVITALPERLNKQMPPGIYLKSFEEIAPRRGKRSLKESHFLLYLDGLKSKEERLEKFLNSESFPITKVGRKGPTQINARPLVKSMVFLTPNRIRLVLNHIGGAELKPAEILNGVFFSKNEDLGGVRILKVKEVFG